MDLVHAWLKETPLLAARPGISSERDVHEAVWKTVFSQYRSRYGQAVAEKNVLSSHTDLPGRSVGSADAWESFLEEEAGPDVRILGSNSRLDLVVRDPNNHENTVGIEVKYLNGKTGIGGFYSGIGQAHIALLNRKSSILVLFCDSIPKKDREALRRQWERMECSRRVHLVVRP